MAERVLGSMASGVTSALSGKHSLQGGYVVFWKGAGFPSTFAQSCKCPWCQRKKNPLSCGMARLCQLRCWTCFNDHFLHIPNKTPLQMGCRNRNSIWELGRCSEAAGALRSGSLTRRDCSWDPRGWAGGSLPASFSGPVHGYAGWSLGLSGLEGG